MTEIILIDLQKTFNTIDRDVLLQKLYAIGFSKHTLNWFPSYLSNRSFLADLENNFSQPAFLSCGVAQGFISRVTLGSLLSMACHKKSNVSFFFYHDDTCLVCQQTDINKIENQLNKDFCNICGWFLDKKLTINFW